LSCDKVSSKWRADATIEYAGPLATQVGEALFPPAEAALIADVIARDLPYYDPTISEVAVAGLNRFAQASGLAQRSVPYNQVVAMEFRHLWTA